MDKIWDNGFRQITSSTKPIAAPADLKVSRSASRCRRYGRRCSRLDASPASINFAEVYSALQTNRRRPGEPAGDHLDGEALPKSRSTVR
jgi:TRAP-type C4-dicarboxylate transport system substrate-binding protein